MSARAGGAVRAAIAAGLALLIMAMAAPAAMAAPWPCDNTGYLSQFDATNPAAGTLFNRAERQPDGTYQLVQLGVFPEHLNAIAFRPQDGFMYGLNNTTLEIVRIENDGTGAPTFTGMGFPPGSGVATSVIGTILADGTYFIWNPAGGAIYDVSGPTAQLITTVTGTGPQGDLAVSPIDGQLYGVATDPGGTWGTYRYTISGGTISQGARVGDGTSAGGQWFLADGRHLQYNNGGTVGPNGYGLYALDVATGQLSFLGPGPSFSNADGASCANGLAITKDASPRTVTAGSELTYTHTITSRGLLPSQLDFADELPAGMTYVPGGVTASPAFGTPNDYGGTATLAISGTVQPGQTITITARVRVAPDHACSVDVQNQSQATLSQPGLPGVTADSDDPSTPADPDDSTAARVECAADLQIVKTASTSPIVPGEDATFTMVVTNNGPSTARNVSVSDQLPADFTFASASSGCAEAGGTLTCTVPSLAPGASQTFTVTGGVASSLDECLENTATVTSATPDPAPANNSSTICTPIEGESNVRLTKRASADTVAPGGQVMYTLVVENDGPSDDPGVTVTDALPAGLTLVAVEPSQGSCTTTGNTASCDLGRLRDGGSAQVLVTANATGTGCITNTARVRGAHEDPDTQDNQASARICVDPPPPAAFDLEVDKTANATRVRLGQRLTYRIVVTNNGPAAAPGARLTDTYNSRARVVSVRTTAGTCTDQMPVTCELGTIAAGDSVTVTVVIRPRDTGRARNAASATGDGTDANPDNNMDTADVRVRKVLLAITKVASRSVVGAGERFSYRIRVRNRTRGVARRVRVCDRLPRGLVFVSSKPRSQVRRGQHCWTIKRLGARKSKTFRVRVRALRGASGRKVNRVVANSRDARRARARRAIRVRAGGVLPGGVTG